MADIAFVRHSEPHRRALWYRSQKFDGIVPVYSRLAISGEYPRLPNHRVIVDLVLDHELIAAGLPQCTVHFN